MNAQFKKGALELCVLAELSGTDRYGYELTDSISAEMDTATGTLYLVLKRLKDEDYVETYLKESDEGPARKYYHMTAKGITYLDDLKKEWNSFVGAVNNIVNK